MEGKVDKNCSQEESRNRMKAEQVHARASTTNREIRSELFGSLLVFIA